MLTSTAMAANCNALLQGPAQPFTEVITDSRAIKAGCLFVALKGESFDGHQFVAQAINAGASGVLVSTKVAAPPTVSVLRVEDTLLALQAIAKAHRAQFSLPVIAVTGSNGKTTTKQMIASIARAHFGDEAVVATIGNLNNHIGVPLTLLRIRAGHKVAIIEMGMNHFHELSLLTRLAQPDVAVITNAGPAHLEGVGSLMGVAKAKGEIFEGLTSGGTAIINRDDAFYAYWQVITRDAKQLSFGRHSSANIKGSFQAPNELVFTLPDAPHVASVALSMPGEHNASNALAAIAATHAIGVSADAMVSGLRVATNVSGRLTQNRLPNGTLAIDDSYNANPASMRAAIDVLRAQSGKRFLVVGDMAEMGENWQALHREVAQYAASAGLDGIFALGPRFQSVAAEFGANGLSFSSLEALVQAVQSRLDGQSTLLAKGAHSMAMHRVIEQLEASLKETA
ncbi:MAG: UDP-N-acetylmuramoyl-tripeptide--D-alanyl-D-alanine ligase [Betaproteobacteria bacterium]|nr:MAG: UDP-N-acetylmuramoyl-tripeptide--D-alanyl-D-alanine ligase [Betaproteobacteria bacterium]